ncbi:hypothetical protein MKW94_005788 [Papaver nudicaule]|uniref:X8 domain-containing protein n=1 Tax=Papaver nudicaule TaxID=74823 RepID=A0AA41VAR7_PAPNU|nr:hypothetical protein [Papaver nudicaule]
MCFTANIIYISICVVCQFAETYCVANYFGVPQDFQIAALAWTCGVVDCSPLQEGQVCFEPNTVSAHASYAYNLYYQQHGRLNGTCDFDGTAMTTSDDPCHGSCYFPDHLPGFSRSHGSRFTASAAVLIILPALLFI